MTETPTEIATLPTRRSLRNASARAASEVRESADVVAAARESAADTSHAPGSADPRPGTGAPQGRSRRREPLVSARSVLGETLLWLAAVAGLICMVLVILAFTSHITLIMFRTGSMSPTIPAGSVAVVQEIPAAQVHVRDVVTVDRPGQLPVTHRVREIAQGDSTGVRLLTLRGDANAQDDPAPYPVSTVRIVRFAIPGLAPVIVALGNPFVLGGLTLGATTLVIWAFWPRDGGSRRERSGGRRERSSGRSAGAPRERSGGTPRGRSRAAERSP